MRRRAILRAIVAATVISGASSVYAVNVPLNNPSIETPAKPNIVQSGGPYGTIPGWEFQCDGASGQNDRDLATYPLSYGALPGGEGELVGFFNHGVGGQVAQAFTNVDTPFGYQPNYKLTATVALGNPSGQNGGGAAYRDPGMYRIQFYSQQHHTLLASSPNIYALSTLPAGAAPGSIAGDIADGQLKDFSFTWVVPADFVIDPSNNAVRIQIQTESFADAQQSSFDNLRLEITVVPEPVSTGALALGGLVFGQRRRR